MGIYGAIFKKIKEKLGKNKNRKKKRKKMPLTKEQRAKRREKFKGAFNKAKSFVQSGNMQNATNTLTRYSQGKPVIIQKKITKDEGTPDTVSIFGYAIPKKTAIIGGVILGAGTIFLISRAVKKRHNG